ncbi:hypothetical protein GEMRC1_010258 [Eukaryota sp. GEM-RC1]
MTSPQHLRSISRHNYIEDNRKRYGLSSFMVTLSKRRATIASMTKELANTYQCETLFLTISESGNVVVHSSDKFAPLLQSSAFQELLQRTLNPAYTPKFTYHISHRI